MRISTSMLFEAGSTRLSDLQSSLMKTQQQIASGRRMLTPADDPIGAARALEVTQAQSTNTQYGVNRQQVKSSLNQAENVLQSVTRLIQDVQTLTIQAGDGVLADAERKYMANELNGRFEELMGLANSRDGTGNFMFAGFQTGTQPFSATPGGATYAGDQGQRQLQVDAIRQIALNIPGSTVFEQNKTGNGTFTLAGGAGNTGTGIFSPGTVLDPTALTGNNYTVTFNVVGGVTTYDIVDDTTATTLSAGNAYTSGQAISFDGIQFEVSGSPADGDTFAVAPSTNQSIFTTLRDLINVLNAPAGTPAGKAALANGLSAANSNLANALDNVLSSRVTAGANLRELDSLDSSGEDKNLQYAQMLMELQDLDYTKAITQLTQQQMTLEAAQKSFIKVSGLSVFNFI